MKVQFKFGDRYVIEVERENIKEVWAELGQICGILIHGRKCGHCGGADIIPHYKTPKGYSYYELLCADCGYRFGLGQLKDEDGLFPKEKEGWTKWSTQEEDQPQHVKPAGAWKQTAHNPSTQRPSRPPVNKRAEEDEAPF